METGIQQLLVERSLSIAGEDVRPYAVGIETMIMNDLIFDVGCNNGDDTDFYLRKGFRVVAIDADRDLCDQFSRRFAAEITAGRCEVICGAVGERTGDLVEFYICDRPDWNTCDPAFMERNEKAGVTYRTVSVPTINVAELMQARGVPYYLKIDVEGADTVPLKTMVGKRVVPTYTSVEIAQHDLAEGLEQIRLLKSLGYTRFISSTRACGDRSKPRIPLGKASMRSSTPEP